MFKTIDTITPDTTIVTASDTQAHTLREQGKLYAIQPNIISLHNWLVTLHQNSIAPRSQIINAMQSLLLWQKIIAPHHDSKFYLQSIHHAQTARHLLAQSMKPASFLLSDTSADHQQLFSWLTAYEQMLHEHNMHDTTALWDMPTLDPRTLPTQHIYFTGFDYISPCMHQLFQKLSQYIQVDWESPRHQPLVTGHRHHFQTKDDEAYAAAYWAKQQIQHQPGCNILIVCHDLNESGRLLERKLNYLLHDAAQPLDTCAYSMTHPSPLTDYHIIRDALTLLTCNITLTIDTNILTSLLDSPYLDLLHFNTPSADRVITKLRKSAKHTWKLSQLLSWLKTINEPKIKHQVQQLKLFISKLSPHQHAPRTWSNIFMQQLKLLGWPGKRALSSDEHILVKRFHRILTELATVDHITHTLTAVQALSLIEHGCQHGKFQNKTPRSHIHICQPHAVCNLQQDAVWIMNMDDQTCPPTPKHHPMISLLLHEQGEFEHASSDFQYQFTLSQLNRIQDTCQHIIYSHVSYIDECLVSPSRFIAHLPLHTLPTDENIRAMPITSIPKNTNAPNSRPKIIHTHARINASTIKYQAQCPYKRFAVCDLNIHHTEQLPLGLSPATNGNLVHTALQYFWEKNKNHHTLIHFSTSELEQEITLCVQESLSDLHHGYEDMLDHVQRDIALQAISKQLARWMELEKLRPPFEVIAIEKEQIINIKDVTVNLRIDRIDRLSNGKHLIIDYKTGLANPNHWFGEVILEPQLPLYALSQNETCGIAFGHINDKVCALSGLCEELQSFSDIKGFNHYSELKRQDISTWPQLMTYWHANMSSLLHHIHSDHPIPTPHNSQVCNLCQLHTLCRIHEESP